MKYVPQITIIGAGNLAWSLIPNLQNAGYRIKQLISRSEENLKHYQEAFDISDIQNDVSKIDPQTDLLILTVNDQAIGEMAQAIQSYVSEDTVCVHTSGSTPLASLSPLGENIGVFYPLQSFTRNQVSEFAKIPLFLEGNERVRALIKPIAEALADQVYFFNSEQRLRLHLGAVWVNNFTNLIYQSAGKLIGDLPFEVYQPLIMGHLEKVFQLGPEATQTGPAIRGDVSTIEKHLELLETQPDLRELYRRLSLGINSGLDLE